MDLNQPLSSITSTLCNFRGCQNELPPDAAFKLCEVCRVTYVTERLTCLSDPFSSRAPHVKDALLSQAITAQTAAEVLQTKANLEYLYLEYSKIIKLHGIEPTQKRVKQTLAEQVEDARNTGQNVERAAVTKVKREKEKLNKLQKQMKALGCKDPTGSRKSGSKGPDGKVRMHDTCLMSDGTECRHAIEANRIFNDVAPEGELGF